MFLSWWRRRTTQSNPQLIRGEGLSPIAEEPGTPGFLTDRGPTPVPDGPLKRPTGDWKASPPYLVSDARLGRATTRETIAESIAGGTKRTDSVSSSVTTQLVDKYNEYLVNADPFSQLFDQDSEDQHLPVFGKHQSAFDKASQELALRLTGKAPRKKERDYWFEGRDISRKDFEHFRKEKELEASQGRQLTIKACIKVEDLQRALKLQKDKLEMAEERVQLLENKGIKLGTVEYGDPEVRPRIAREKVYKKPEKHVTFRGDQPEEEVSDVQFIYDYEMGQQLELRADTLLVRAYLKMQLKDWRGVIIKASEAMSIAKTELQYEPLAQRAMYYLGVAYLEMGEFETAIDLLNKADGCRGKYMEGEWVIQKYGEAQAAMEEHQKCIVRELFNRSSRYGYIGNDSPPV